MYNFEQIGFIPRSIIRTLKRFFKQISLKTDLFVIYEFRVSRYIAIASLQCFFFLIICPWTFQFFVKFIFLNTFLKYQTIPLMGRPSVDVFINIHQQERAFSQIQTFSQKIYFETLLESFDFVRGPEGAATALELGLRLGEAANNDSTNPRTTKAHWGFALKRLQGASFVSPKDFEKKVAEFEKWEGIVSWEASSCATRQSRTTSNSKDVLFLKGVAPWSPFGSPLGLGKTSIS